MDGMTKAHRYGALGCQLLKRGHRNLKWLTASPEKAFAASGRAPKDWVDGGGELERETSWVMVNPCNLLPKRRDEGTYGHGESRWSS